MTKLEEYIYTLTINTYGHQNQIDMLIEEMAELIQAISKRRRGKEKDNVEEEIADVQIMLDQLKLMCDQDEIEKIKDKKKQRLLEKLYTFIGDNVAPDPKSFEKYIMQYFYNPEKFTNEKIIR